jgi:uncharacterized protein (TIGR03067 family)
MCKEYEMLRLFTLPLMLLVYAVPSEAADVAPEGASLGGAWTAVEAERAGAPAQEIVGHRLELAGNRFRLSVGNRLLYAGTYAIEPTTQPARIDFRHDEGEARGEVWEGIYRLEGGRLSICDNAPDTDRPRPMRFATSPGSGYVFVVFER